MRRMLTGLSSVLALFIIVGSASAATSSPSILYSVSAGSAIVQGRELALPAAAKATWFSDRPDRRAGRTTVGSIVTLWSASGFDRVPPNAALVTKRDGATMTTIVTLTRPRLEGDTVRFRFRVVKSGSAMGMRTTGTPARGSYGRTELFIDGAATPPCSYGLDRGQSCLFDVAQGAYSYVVADPGHVQICSVGTQATGVNVSWYYVSAQTNQPAQAVHAGLAPPLCDTVSTYGDGSSYGRFTIRVERGASPSGVVRVTATT